MAEDAENGISLTINRTERATKIEKLLHLFWEKATFCGRCCWGATVSFRLQARNYIVTACQRSCGKVMFSVVSVIMFGGGPM